MKQLTRALSSLDIYDFKTHKGDFSICCLGNQTIEPPDNNTAYYLPIDYFDDKFQKYIVSDDYIKQLTELGKFDRVKQIELDHSMPLLERNAETDRYELKHALSTELSNIDIYEDEQVLEFCKTYGLLRESPAPYALLEYGKTCGITLEDFRHQVVNLRELIHIKTALDWFEKIESPWDASVQEMNMYGETLLHSILFFAFYSSLFDDEKAFRSSNVNIPFLVHHVGFNQYLKRISLDDSKSEYFASTDFLIRAYLISMHGSPQSPIKGNSLSVVNAFEFYSSKEGKNFLSTLDDLFPEGDEPLVRFTMKDHYGNFSFTQVPLFVTLLFDERYLKSEFAKKFFAAGRFIFTSILNFQLAHFRFSVMEDKDGKLCATPIPDCLLDVIYLELYMLLNSGSTIAQCARPGCSRIFTQISGRKDRIYCCGKCQKYANVIKCRAKKI